MTGNNRKVISFPSWKFRRLIGCAKTLDIIIGDKEPLNNLREGKDIINFVF